MAGLYIHIPFCHSKCAYCNFYSVADRRRADALVSAIKSEWEARAPEIGGHEAVRTIYIGGGTPSCLSASQFACLADALPYSRQIEEYTIEVNPEDVTPQSVKLWRGHGVNRISMGIQSFDDSELKAINRRHNPDDALRAVETIRDGGIENISCDIIYGLPGQSTASWRHTLDKLLSLGIPHFSAYCLSYEEGTLLFRRLQQGLINAASDEVIAAMYDYLCEAAADAGFEHYEIANFARKGKRSVHNSNYWNATPYLGLGPGAHSCDTHGIIRFNPPDIRNYTDSTQPVCRIDEENETDRFNDLVITGLRTADGIRLDRVGNDRLDILLRDAAPYLSRDMLRLADGRLSIPEKHWLVSDSIIRDIMQ